MKYLYDLNIHTWLNGDEQNTCGIGIFSTREEAEQVAEQYLSEVQGFRDYYCEAEVREVPVIGERKNLQKIWSFTGWNEDANLNELDILKSPFYTTRAAAREAMKLVKTENPRQYWDMGFDIIGKCQWEEGFTREHPSGEPALTMRQVRDTLSSCIEPRSICAVEFEYDDNKHYYFPFAVSEQLFLGAEEDDFLLDGFCVRRIRDVYEISERAGVYQKIFETEGLTRFDAPPVDISDWHSVFTSLQKMGRNVIVENEYADGFFYIGHIEEVGPDHVLLRHFDADGIWQEEPARIEFRDVTSVTFDSRYVDVFSKYV